MKKINQILVFTFLLLSLSIWATEIPENSTKVMYVSNSETIFIHENRLSYVLTNDLFGTEVIVSPTNISNNKIDSTKLNITETKLKISNFDSGKLLSNLFIEPNTTITGLNQFFVVDSKQTEKHFTSNQFYDIQGDVFISSGTIFYIEDNKKNIDLTRLAQKHQSTKTIVKKINNSKQKHSKPPTIIKDSPFSGNSLFGFCGVKLALVPSLLKSKVKKLNAFYVVKHKQSLFYFNYQKNFFLAINQGAIQQNYCKYCFSLPPPLRKL